jgi:hypothetical protein
MKTSGLQANGVYGPWPEGPPFFVVEEHHEALLAPGEAAIKCPCPLNVIQDTYDHSWY